MPSDIVNGYLTIDSVLIDNQVVGGIVDGTPCYFLAEIHKIVTIVMLIPDDESITNDFVHGAFRARTIACPADCGISDDHGQAPRIFSKTARPRKPTAKDSFESSEEPGFPLIKPL